MLGFPLADIHTHGCIGFDYTYASQAQMRQMGEYYLSEGVELVLPTLTAMDRDGYERQIESLLPLIFDEKCPFAGLNLEGPFLNSAKKGAINGLFLREVDMEFVHRLWEISRGTIKIMTAAPEMAGFDRLCRFARGKFVVAMGHSAADSDITHAGIAAGASHVTHLFNAMDGLHHRKPGLVGAALAENVTKEVICDGVHLHDDVVRLLFKGFADEIVMVSDSMAACGLSDGVYTLSGQDVFVKDGRATLCDGTIAGSCRSLRQDVERCLELGIDGNKLRYSAWELPRKIMGL